MCVIQEDEGNVQGQGGQDEEDEDSRTVLVVECLTTTSINHPHSPLKGNGEQLNLCYLEWRDSLRLKLNHWQLDKSKFLPFGEES